MALYVSILVGFLVALLYMIFTQPAERSATILVKGGPILLIVIGVLLTLLGRRIVGLPLIFIGITWWRRTRVLRPMTPSGGRKSVVRSSHLEMELDHDTGELDGRVLTGTLEGTRLSSLSEEELISLYLEIRFDSESAALLESYLDRYYPEWHDHVKNHTSGWNETSDSGEMTKQEAYEILGVTPDASREEILESWRRLIKRVHPDSGGSAFLATKINTAKSVLLDE